MNRPEPYWLTEDAAPADTEVRDDRPGGGLLGLVVAFGVSLLLVVGAITYGISVAVLHGH